MRPFLTLLIAAIVALFAIQLASAKACDRAYPTVCIAPKPPNLDCKNIPHRNFPVRSPDPHRFDRDRDGIGCETR
ncbi:excalibur calcium-binding domain-containing protein [Leptolyngbya sp. FACHB-36]|uniref:excalibur calcium-binding domain-containing protein n=1 Tax=Leptolyngbya sp. FACHB-36 TaxID=2692808 RepID=UPI001681024E|nr:excalibur calcium-binding domain-containing protein [Leptolyngbya sp. FACHB-36]MBD2020647.1 excalibur calcium-binding domain-containing protein [Leptolyngbya sp. FACHB-36]